MTLAHAATAAPAFLPHLAGATKQLIAMAGIGGHNRSRVHDEPALAGWTSADGMVSCHAIGDDVYVDADFDHQPEDMGTILGLLDDHGYVPASDDPEDDELLDDGVRVYFTLETELVAA